MRKLIKKRYILSIVFVLTVLPLAGLGVISLRATKTALCRVCQKSDRQAVDMTFTDLSKNPEKYTGQIVRLKAVLRHDAGYTFLHDPNATGLEQAIRVGFGKDYIACSSTQDALSFHTGLGTWYDGEAKVTLTGTYGIIDDQRKFSHGETGLTLLCLEEVTPVHSSRDIALNTARYAIGRMGKLVLYPFKDK